MRPRSAWPRGPATRQVGEDTPNAPPLRGNPPQARERIFRNLVVRNDPIHVYDGWARVYVQTRQTQQGHLFAEQVDGTMQPVNLRMCKMFFREGIRVLYGGNKFLYRLRDAPPEAARPVVDGDRLAHNDSTTNEEASEGDIKDDNDSDPGYEEEPARPAAPTRRSARGRKKQARMDAAIHIAKYYPLFRFIIVEAEHNRYGEDAMKGTADAINVFAKPPELEHDMIPIVPKTRLQQKSAPMADSSRPISTPSP